MCKSDEVQGEIYLAVAKFGGKLRVLVSEAKDLAAKDFGGSSDPYCQLTFNGTEVPFFPILVLYWILPLFDRIYFQNEKVGQDSIPELDGDF